MPTLELRDCLVIVLRTEESKPIVIEAFDSELDVARSVHWLASQPELLELVVRAYRLARTVDGTLDSLGESVGYDGAWLEAWRLKLQRET